MNEKGLSYIVMVAIVIIANAISAAGHIIDGTIKSDGKLMFDNGGCNLILLVGFLLMLTVFIHKYIKERKAMKNLKLKAARAAKDLSQDELAKLCNVSRQTISAIEKGDYNPTINLCIAICKALDKTLDELFWE